MRIATPATATGFFFLSLGFGPCVVPSNGGDAGTGTLLDLGFMEDLVQSSDLIPEPDLFSPPTVDGGTSGACEAASETLSTLDSSLATVGPVIVDSAGTVHAAIHDDWPGDLQYAKRVQGSTQSWMYETIDAPGSGGQAIAVDAKGNVSVAYENSTGEKYATRSTAGTWKIESVDNVGGPSALRVDAAGVVHIVYVDSVHATLKYARRALGATTFALATIDTGVGDTVSIGIDGVGTLHAAYYDSVNADLKYASKTPTGSWVTSTIDAPGVTGKMPSLAIDGSGTVHITYHSDVLVANVETISLKHASRPSGGAWTVETVDSQPTQGWKPHRNSLTVDAAGTLYDGLAYVDWGGNHIAYYRRISGASWATWSGGPTGDCNSTDVAVAAGPERLEALESVCNGSLIRVTQILHRTIWCDGGANPFPFTIQPVATSGALSLGQNCGLLCTMPLGDTFSTVTYAIPPAAKKAPFTFSYGAGGMGGTYRAAIEDTNGNVLQVLVDGSATATNVVVTGDVSAWAGQTIIFKFDLNNTNAGNYPPYFKPGIPSLTIYE